MVKYQPLVATGNEIRLLYFKQGSSDTHSTSIEDIEFELRHASLDDHATPGVPKNISSIEDIKDFQARESERDRLLHHQIIKENFGRWTWGDYTTLSYTWGDSTQTWPITINGCVMQVTANLYSFLGYYLNSKQSSSKRMGLWIDAICINQGDINERNHEVSRMGYIYSHAFGSIVWLGDASFSEFTLFSDHTDKAMDLLNSFEPQLLATRDGWSSHGKLASRHRWTFPTGSWAALYRVISQPYWSRLWIIQEIALSQGNPWRVRVVCGNRDVSWTRFIAMISTCAYDLNNFMSKLIEDYDEMYGSPDFGDEDDMRRWTPAFERIQEFSWLDSLSNERKDLVLTRLLALSRSSHQTDPRDKVYAILGLMDARLSRMIKPDYTLSKAEIFKDFAQMAIRFTKRLDIITCQGISNGDRELPSWVPDMTERICVGTDMTANLPYGASKDSTAVVTFRANDLIVQGIVVDQIDGRGTPDSNRSDFIPSEHSNNPYGSELGVRDAIWRTFFANRDILGDLISESCSRILDRVIATPGSEEMDEDSNMFETGFCWMVYANSDFRICGQELISFFWHQMEERPKAPEWKLTFDPFARINSLGNGRLPITTTKGYFGLARLGVERGDSVCVLLGCSVPVILRKNADGQSYRFIGESYIHGVMDGEVMDWLKEGKYSLESMCIR